MIKRELCLTICAVQSAGVLLDDDESETLGEYDRALALEHVVRALELLEKICAASGVTADDRDAASREYSRILRRVSREP